jgi:hypothetical protein
MAVFRLAPSSSATTTPALSAGQIATQSIWMEYYPNGRQSYTLIVSPGQAWPSVLPDEGTSGGFATPPTTTDSPDIEIGGVEIKDSASDTRAKVTTSAAQDTDAGLVVRLPRRGTLTDKSGTITLGGTAQTLTAINTSRRYMFIMNPPTESERLWINFTTTATGASPSIPLDPGASFVFESLYVTTELISVIAATTGHAFIAKEG